MDLRALLGRRRSIREFAPRPVGQDDVQALLWAAQGRTADGRRTTPSAVATYPLELIVARGPDPAGTWDWDVETATLRPRGTEDVRERLCAAAIGDQPWVAAAPVTIVLCADVGAMVERFADQPPGDRGRRYLDVEVGAAVQNLALTATYRGLGGVIVGGFDDAAVASALGLPSSEPRLLFSLGHPA